MGSQLSTEISPKTKQDRTREKNIETPWDIFLLEKNPMAKPRIESRTSIRKRYN